jgi:hypothetical protein
MKYHNCIYFLVTPYHLSIAPRVTGRDAAPRGSTGRQKKPATGDATPRRATRGRRRTRDDATRATTGDANSRRARRRRRAFEGNIFNLKTRSRTGG